MELNYGRKVALESFMSLFFIIIYKIYNVARYDNIVCQIVVFGDPALRYASDIKFNFQKTEKEFNSLM